MKTLAAVLVAAAVLAGGGASAAANDGMRCSIAEPGGTEMCEATCSAGEHAFCWGVYVPDAAESNVECTCVRLPEGDFQIIIAPHGHDGHDRDHDAEEDEEG